MAGYDSPDTLEDAQVEEDEMQQRSTKRPLPKRKRHTKTTAECVMDETMSVLKAFVGKKQTLDDNDIFGQNIACGLRKITDARSKELAKVKIQEIIFQAQFGLLPGALPTQHSQTLTSIQLQQYPTPGRDREQQGQPYHQAEFRSPPTSNC